MSDLNDDDIFMLIHLQTALLLLWAFSSLSNIATATQGEKNDN